MSKLKSIFSKAAIPALALLGLAQQEEAKAQTPITACTTITQSGSYQLAADLQSAGAHCIKVENTSNINIYGQGHTISVLGGGDYAAIRFKNVSGATVQDVKFQGYGGAALSLNLEASQSITAWSNTFNEAAIFADANSKYMYITSNLSMINSPIFSSANPTYITYNKLETDTAYAIAIFGGSGHYIAGNTIDGKWNGTFPPNGVDDGIIISDIENSTISGNTISNIYDCGIEMIRSMKNTYIEWNNINHAGYCGFGGWWDENHTNYDVTWIGNVARFNNVSNTPNLFVIMSYGLGVGPFINNTITNNTLTNQSSRRYWPSFSLDQSGAIVIGFVKPVVGNVISNNNFGIFGSGPYLSPPQGFTGSQNICTRPPVNNPSPYPITCSLQ